MQQVQQQFVSMEATTDQKKSSQAKTRTSSTLFVSKRTGKLATKKTIETRKRRDAILVGYRAIQDNQNETCAICLANCEVGNDIYTTSCNHTYHTKCLNSWYKRKTTCPQCLACIEIHC